MCQVSDKLKLCTCDTDDYHSLKHYWTLHRFIKGKENYLVGEGFFPYFMDRAMHLVNYETILHLLNEANPFDVDLKPLKKDRLCLCFTCDDEGNRIYYGFRYNGRKWVKQGYDSLEWEWHHEQQQAGTILNALDDK